MKVLFDLNVVLDVIEGREPFVRDSATALGRVVSTPRAQACIATHAVTTCFYILKKHIGLDAARLALRRLLDVFTVLPAPAEVLREAIDTDCPDYEDAVSYLAAAKSKCDYVVTRNLGDFRNSSIPVLSPDQFLIRTARR